MTRNSYYGGQERKLDYKGRLVIPDDLMSQGEPLKRAVLIRAASELPGGPFHFVSFYDVAGWQELLQSTPRDLDADEVRLFMHKRVADAATVDVDAMSRITVPERLLQYASIEKPSSVWVMGLLNHIELWNPSIYSSYIAALDDENLPVPDLFELARNQIREVSEVS